jgi:outer membrane protein OmpA-like peptidoglycan-associated protein
MISDPTRRAIFNQRSDGNPVSAQFIGYADVGVEILDRLGIQVEFPVILYQAGHTTNVPDAGAPTTIAPQAVAPMDLRLDARLIAFRTETRNFKAGVGASVWLPTGNGYSYGGDGGAHGAVSISLEYDPKKFFLVANTGLHFRPRNSVNDFVVQNEFTFGAGAFLPLRDNTVRLGLEIFGSTSISDGSTKANTPVEWMAEGRLALDQKKQLFAGLGGGTRMSAGYAPDFRIVALIGGWFGIKDTDPGSPGKRFKAERYADHGADTDKDGIPDDIDLCPNDPEDHKPPNPDDGCPALPDRDGDGIPDVSDKCPDQPEDFDKIDDQDGCPEDDADKDGVPDAQDACPKEPGEPSSDPAKNGCPQFIRRISGSSEIQILKQVEFQTGSAKILPRSFPILDEVVRLLKVNPDIKHLDVEGHTDNRGSHELNEKLSADRAKSCMEYIIAHGIAAGRMSSEGFGPDKPIADNATAEGRQRNRRTEFHIRNDK